jgi:prepilin-type N-terminal cleavage/methylation domain-containing protein
MKDLLELIKTKKLHNEKGFTLIEIIVVITLIALVAGLSGFGVNILFQANVASMGNEIYHDLRDIRFRATSEFDTEYQLIFTYDTATERYGYKVQKRFTDYSGGTALVKDTIVKEVSYGPTLSIEQYSHDSLSWVSLKDPSLDIGTHPENVTFKFLQTTGGIDSQSISSTTTNGLASNSTKTVGIYRVVSLRTNDIVELTIVGKTGRVVIRE